MFPHMTLWAPGTDEFNQGLSRGGAHGGRGVKRIYVQLWPPLKVGGGRPIHFQVKIFVSDNIGSDKKKRKLDKSFSLTEKSSFQIINVESYHTLSKLSYPIT